MTLIITARARSHVVVTADGRCRTTTNGFQKKASDTLQKIFPLPNRGFAVAHHGENIIEGCKVKDIVEQFFSDNMSGIRITSVSQIARIFVKRYGDNIRKTLQRISDSKLCGFLFLGFGTTINKPKIHEAFWKKQNVNDIVHKTEERGNLVLSGDAKKYICRYTKEPVDSQFRWENIYRGDVEYSKAFCNRLYQLAEDAQTKAGEDIFGGYKHQLVIEKSGYKWLIPSEQADSTTTSQ